MPLGILLAASWGATLSVAEIDFEVEADIVGVTGYLIHKPRMLEILESISRSRRNENGQDAPWARTSYVLPTRIVGQQLLSVLNATVPVETESQLTSIRLNPESFEREREAALALLGEHDFETAAGHGSEVCRPCDPEPVAEAVTGANLVTLDHCKWAMLVATIGCLALAILAVFVALIASRPLGMTLQARYTVDPELGDLRVTSIRQVSPSPVTRLFQLLLGQAKNDNTHAFRVETVG